MAEKKKSTRQSKTAASLAKSAAAVAETASATQEAASAPEQDVVPPALVASSGPPRVDLPTFWRMQHAAASMRAAKAEAETARMKKLYILALLDTKNRVLDAEKEIDKAKKLAESHENTYLTFKRDIESRLGRPLANIAVDPDTGLVSHIPSK